MYCFLNSRAGFDDRFDVRYAFEFPGLDFSEDLAGALQGHFQAFVLIIISSSSLLSPQHSFNPPQSFHISRASTHATDSNPTPQVFCSMRNSSFLQRLAFSPLRSCLFWEKRGISCSIMCFSQLRYIYIMGPTRVTPPYVRLTPFLFKMTFFLKSDEVFVPASQRKISETPNTVILKLI